MSRWPLLIFRSVGQRSRSKVTPILYMLGKGGGALMFYKHLLVYFLIRVLSIWIRELSNCIKELSYSNRELSNSITELNNSNSELLILNWITELSNLISLRNTCPYIRSRQWNFKSRSRKITKKSPENKILAKGNNSCKSRSNAIKVKLDLNYGKTNSFTEFQVKITKKKRERKVRKTNFFAKGNNSSKSTSTVTKVELDLYHVKAKLYTKFQVNISKDDWESSENRVDGHRVDWRTDWHTEGRTDWLTETLSRPPPPGFTGRGLINRHFLFIFIKKSLKFCKWPNVPTSLSYRE